MSMRISEEISICAREGCDGPVMWEVARVAQSKESRPGEATERVPTGHPQPRSRVGTCQWCGTRYRVASNGRE